MQPSNSNLLWDHTPTQLVHRINEKSKALLLILAVIVAIILPIYLVASLTTNTITTSPNLQATPNIIDWGTLRPTQQVTRQITLSNVGDASTQPLTMTHDSAVGVVTWNLEGLTLYKGQNVIAKFTLTAFENASEGAFSFNITVTG